MYINNKRLESENHKIPTKVKILYDDALSFYPTDKSTFMLKARQIIEAIVNDFNCEGNNLAERINKLNDNGIKEAEIYSLHYIRKNANREIHLENVRSEEYSKCKDMLNSIIEHIYIKDKWDNRQYSSTIKNSNTANWQPNNDKTIDETFISNKINNLKQHSIMSLYLEGYGYESGGEYIKAMEIYKMLVEAGGGNAISDNAIFRMANLYLHGKGVEKDVKKAIQLYEKLADSSVAMIALAEIYEDSEGEYVDYKKAFELYMKAAKQNDADAMYRIGNLYEKGKGCEKKTMDAIKWYMKSAIRGNEDAKKAAYDLKKKTGMIREK